MKIKYKIMNLVNFIFLKLKFIKGIYYINSPDNLPPPLSKEEEVNIFAKLEENDEEAKQILIVHNLRLVVYIAKKFESTGICIDDLISIGTIGLIKAVNTFRPSKNIKLATYASRCIENEILMHLRKVQSGKNDISIDEPLNVDWDGNELLLSDILGTDENVINYHIESDVEKNILISAVNNLGQRERSIMNLRFGLQNNNEHTQKEVADIIGISQSYISRIEKRIIKKLKKDLEKVIWWISSFFLLILIIGTLIFNYLEPIRKKTYVTKRRKWN